MIRQKKAQVWYIDFIIGITIFLTALVVFFTQINNPIGNTIMDDQLIEASTISDSLMTAGHPTDWNRTNVERIGITDNNQRINQTKLLRFSNIEYAKSRSLFRTKYDFFVFVEEDGCLVNINGTYSIGHIAISISNNGEDFSCIDQTINTDVDVDNGNVLLQNCQVNGNVDVDEGTLTIISSNITGNIETEDTRLDVHDSTIGGNIDIDLEDAPASTLYIIRDNNVNGNVIVEDGTLYIVSNVIIGNLEALCPTTVLANNNNVNGNTDLCSTSSGCITRQDLYPNQLDAKNLVKVERLLIYNSEPAKMVIYMWN